MVFLLSVFKGSEMHKIVIVGGGAGGLELATKLGDSLGKKKKAEITLIDCTKTHVWKPLLHEIAAGSMNPDKHELEYMAQAHWHHFRFRLGRMDRLNRHKKEVSIAPYIDEDGKEIIPRRSFQYDTLIISVGSTTNDFGIKGAAEHSIALDTQEQAEVFHQKLHHADLLPGGFCRHRFSQAQHGGAGDDRRPACAHPLQLQAGTTSCTGCPRCHPNR